MKQYLNFSNKVVLVTGSTRGIGLVIAETFVERGATVIVNGRSSEGVVAAEKLLKERGHSVVGVRADIGDKSDIDTLVLEIKNRFGHLDILINNAALREWSFLEDVSDELWEKTLQTNLFGVFHLIKKITPLLKNGSNPSIVNISSIAAIRPLFTSTGVHYVVSKGALLSLTRGLAKELGEYSIRVNAVMPGLVNKDVNKNFEQKHSSIANETFLKKLPNSQDVANACLFLASDMASSITGENIVIGG